MNTHNKTVLITGGSAGIGFETAKLFSKNGCRVIIVGRNEARLKTAATKLPNVAYFVADISRGENIDDLAALIAASYPTLDILINNAAYASIHRLHSDLGTYTKAKEEIETNYLSAIKLTEAFLPILEGRPEAAIINVTSIVALAPGIRVPTYSASKAALHSYTSILRLTLAERRSPVKVFELLPPLVNTDFSKGIGGEQRGIAPEAVAQELLNGLENDVAEIRVGATDVFYKTFFAGSENAVAALYKAAQDE